MNQHFNSRLQDDLSEVKDDGLRYAHKAGGSPFGGPGECNTRSCFLCSVHTPLSMGRGIRFVGKSQFVCFACRPAPAASTKS